MDDLFTRVGWNLVLCIPFGIVVWILTRVPKIHARPAVCHVLWLLVLLKIVTPPFISMPVMPATMTLVPDFSNFAAQSTATIGSEPKITLAASTTETTLSPQGSQSSASRTWASRSNMNPWRIAMIVVVLTSLATTIIVWLMAVRQLQKLQRLLTGHPFPSDRANQLLAKVATQFRLRRMPNLIAVDSPIAPIVWAGPRQSVIVLSQQLIQSLRDDQLEHVLAHELAHLERRDHWSNLFGFFVATLFWWHPIAWLARRELCLAAESCCDAMVLERCTGSRKSYAQTLLSVIDLVNCGEFSRPALLLNFGGTSSLRKRIQMLSDSSVRTRISIGGWILLLIVAASSPFLLTRAQDTKQPPQPTPANVDQKITVAAVQSSAVTLTQQYVCQIHASRYIKVRTPEKGFVETISVQEGQAVKAGDLLFQIKPEASKDLVSIKAPFDGKIGQLLDPQGSFVMEGETLTTLSDSSLMWVYFNVPEALYLEYMAYLKDRERIDDLKIELVLADGKKFPEAGKIGAIEADFNSKTGSVPFRADFANRDRLLRHGQTGTLLIGRALKNAIAIPQRAVLEFNNKRFVFVVDKNNVAHQREIVIENETEDQFVVKTGISAGDKIVVDGVRLVRDGQKVDGANP